MKISEFREQVASAVAAIRAAEQQTLPEHFNPGEKQCRWCKAKGICPALAQFSINMVYDDFVDLSQPLPEPPMRAMDNILLGNAMAAIPLIEIWISGVREAVYHQLEQGNAVPGFKLVEGRRGSRKWIDEQAAAQQLESIIGEATWSKTLISPTVAQKRCGDRFDELAGLITQSEGKPSVAPESDKRAAIESPQFEELT